jgi:pimeloyl-ACP methyl ester carboxylesterase
MKSQRWIAGAAGVAALAGTAACVAWAARRAETANPPRGYLIEIDGVRVHYLDQGEGPVVLLLHGQGSTANDFVAAGLFEALARHHRVIAIDRPGFGHSERPRNQKWGASEQAELIAAALGRLGIGSATVVGHSWAVLTAIALALNAPHHVSRLVLMSGYFYAAFRPDAWLGAVRATPVLGDVMRYTTSAVEARLTLGLLTKRTFSPQPVPPQFFAHMPKGMLLRPSQLFAVAQESKLLAGEAARLSASYPRLTMPVAIVAGSADGVLSTEQHSIRLHRHVPHSTLTVLDGVGHMPHHAAPQAVIAAIAGTTPLVETSPVTPSGGVEP